MTSPSRAYRRGERGARSRETVGAPRPLLVREYEQPQGADVPVAWRELAALCYEDRIRRRAPGVDEAEREGRRYASNCRGSPRSAGTRRRASSRVFACARDAAAAAGKRDDRHDHRRRTRITRRPRSNALDPQAAPGRSPPPRLPAAAYCCSSARMAASSRSPASRLRRYPGEHACPACCGCAVAGRDRFRVGAIAFPLVGRHRCALLAAMLGSSTLELSTLAMRED